MIGQLLLRLLYRYGGFVDLYRGFASRVECSRVLADIGGGSGLLYNSLRSLCSYYILVDIDEELVDHGFKRLRGCCVDAVIADAHNLPLRANCCSVVLHDSLHHFENPLAALEEAFRVSGDCVYVRDVNPSSIVGRLVLFFEKLLGFPARGLTPRKAAETGMVKGFRVAGFEVGEAQYTIIYCRPNSIESVHGSSGENS